ncbi:MAG TPA: DUF3365 domain-containing protein [Kofleriaceae bacterium]|nr:DUF3365 domain-containing protein [Kofleriaceae bacterium]
MKKKRERRIVPAGVPTARRSTAGIAAIGLAAALSACSSEAKGGDARGDGISPRRAADMIQAVLAADREVYTKEIVQRLTIQQKVQIAAPGGGSTPLEAREDWRSEHGKLPLPAQVFRMGAEKVLSTGSDFSYLLLSPWPVNPQNRPRTDVERGGLEQASKTGQPHYASEELDGKRYFVAIYPDRAVAEACVECHNKHPDSPRRDFKLGDVMGGVVIRFRAD